MASKEYYDGKLMEGNIILHQHLTQVLKFTNIDVRGETTTKGDIVGYRGDVEVPISIKHGSQKNTQVHLPTLRSFAKAMNTPADVTALLEQWLGVTDQAQFQSWLNGKTPTRAQQKYKRLFADDIPNWGDVLTWFNANNTQIAKLLVQAMNGEAPAEYLVWVNKNKNTFQVIDIARLVDWITKECKWVTGSRNNGSTLRCEDSNGKPIFHLQMKGSGGTNGEYNHSPQFHIHTHWPDSVIMHQGSLVA